MIKPIAHLATKAKISFFITLAFFGALIGLFAAWDALVNQSTNWPRFAVQCLPLVPLLPGLLKKYYRSYSWLCFVLLFYFIFAVQNVFVAKIENGLLVSMATTRDIVFLCLVVGLFISAMLASRWLQRVAKSQ